MFGVNFKFYHFIQRPLHVLLWSVLSLIIYTISIPAFAQSTIIQTTPNTSSLAISVFGLLSMIILILFSLIWYLWMEKDKITKFSGKMIADKKRELKSEKLKLLNLRDDASKREQEKQIIFDSINDIVFEIRVDGQIKYINEAWSDLIKQPVKDAIGKNLLDYVADEDANIQKMKFSELGQGKRAAYSDRITFIHEDNSISMQLSISMLRQDEDKNLCLIGTIRNLDHLDRLENAAIEAESKYKSILQNVKTGIYQISEHGELLLANKALAKMLHYENLKEFKNEVVRFNDSIYPEIKARQTFLKHLKNNIGAQQTITLQAKTKADNRIWVEETVRCVYDKEHDEYYYEGTFEDITRRRQHDMALEKAKLDSDLANRAKSEFIANMSHELRTPLNSIIGFAEIIKDEVLGEIAEESYIKYAEEIHTSGQRLLEAFNQILDISKIETGERSLNESLVDCNKLSDIIIKLLTTKIESKNLIIANELSSDMPLIFAEELALRQMIYNLLSNAVKFTAEEGHITIHNGLNQDGDFVFSITDTGIGLTEEEIQRALTAFDLVETEASRKTYGLGLGLTLVKKTIELHGGKLELISQKNIGTTASLIFPKSRISKRKKMQDKSRLGQIIKDQTSDVIAQESTKDSTFVENQSTTKH